MAEGLKHAGRSGFHDGLGSLEVVHVVYWDHVSFRRMLVEEVGPSLRETVGWLLKEDEKALLIIWDKAVEPLPNERLHDGLVILKSDVVEVRRMRFS